jgi:hypothetical protein
MYLCLIVFVENAQKLRQIKNLPTLSYQHSRHLLQDGRHSLKHHYLLKKTGTKRKPQRPLLDNIKEKTTYRHLGKETSSLKKRGKNGSFTDRT